MENSLKKWTTTIRYQCWCGFWTEKLEDVLLHSKVPEPEKPPLIDSILITVKAYWWTATFQVTVVDVVQARESYYNNPKAPHAWFYKLKQDIPYSVSERDSGYMQTDWSEKITPKDLSLPIDISSADDEQEVKKTLILTFPNIVFVNKFPS